MEHFLSELDYEFYNYKCLFSLNIVFMTNEKKIQVKSCEVDNNEFCVIKDDITHLRTNYNFDYDNKDNDFSSIKYLDANNSFGEGTYNSKYGLTKFINLKTLVMNISNIDDEVMSNLPNIKTLIFVTPPGTLTLYFNLDFEFTNLPITLEKIIFKISDEKKENIEYVNLFKNKLSAYKYPFGCKIFFIGGNDEIFTIL